MSLFSLKAISNECKILNQVKGSIKNVNSYEGLLFGEHEIKKLIKKNDDHKISKILKSMKKNTQFFMFVAPFRTSADLILRTNLIRKKNKITFSFEYKLNNNTLGVLDQKFYLGIFSNSCLLEFKTLPVLDKEFQNETNLKNKKN